MKLSLIAISIALTARTAAASNPMAVSDANNHAESSNPFNDGDLPGYNPNRRIVKYKDGAGHAAATKAASQIHVEINSQNLVAATIPEQAVRGLVNNPHIEYVEEDPPRYLARMTSSHSLRGYDYETMVANEDGIQDKHRKLLEIIPYGVGMVNANKVTDLGKKKVCIIDSGYSGTHPDLPHTSTGTPAVDGEDDQDWDTDLCGHGTHVAGTIAALTNNDKGVMGVTDNTSLFIVKVFGDTTVGSCDWSYSSDLISAIVQCQNQGQADVINMSLGGTRSIKSEKTAMDEAYASGVLLVAAAGNDGNNRQHYPASYNSVLSVAAVDSAGARASFSQRNSQVDVGAPGVAVFSTVHEPGGNCTVDNTGYFVSPMEYSGTGTKSGLLINCGLGHTDSTCTGNDAAGKVCLIERGTHSFAEKADQCKAAGGIAAIIWNNVEGGLSGTLGSSEGAWIPTVSASMADGLVLKQSQIGKMAQVSVSGPIDTYGYMDGTSMASPHVAGVAALIWSHKEEATAVEVRNALQVTASGGGERIDDDLGYGIIDAEAAVAYLTGATLSPTSSSTPAGTPSTTPDESSPSKAPTTCLPGGDSCGDKPCCNGCHTNGKWSGTCKN